MKMTPDEALRILEENSYLVETTDPVTVTSVASAAVAGLSAFVAPFISNKLMPLIQGGVDAVAEKRFMRGLDYFMKTENADAVIEYVETKCGEDATRKEIEGCVGNIVSQMMTRHRFLKKLPDDVKHDLSQTMVSRLAQRISERPQYQSGLQEASAE